MIPFNAMTMGLEGRINARTTTPYHVQLQLEGKSEPSRSPSEVVLQGRVVRIFRGDGRLGSGDCVAFKLWVCPPGDDPTGPALIYYEPFMQATHIEAYLHGTPPNCQLAAYEFEALSGPTDEPMMTVAQLQELAVPAPCSAKEQPVTVEAPVPAAKILKKQWWKRLLSRCVDTDF